MLDARTRMQAEARVDAAEDARARAAIEDDPEVREIVDMFQGEVIKDSIKRTPNNP